MQIKIKPTQIGGTISAPASKSLTIRAIAAAALCDAKTILKNFTMCNDAQAAVNIIKTLGANVDVTDNEICISGKISCNNAVLQCGESALSTKIFAPIAATICQNIEMLGQGSLLARDISDLLKALSQLGLSCDGEKYLPIRISGQIENNNITIDGSGGSQTLSGLLMALPLCDKNSEIEVLNLKSKPYIDLTMRVLANFGIKIKNCNYRHFTIFGNQKYTSPRIYSIDGDWSGASCILVAGAIGGCVCVKNLNIQSRQADSAMLDVLQLCGADIKIKSNEIFVERNQLRAFNFDANDCPDLFPAIVALAANCDGISVVKGVLRLKNKESDRGIILQSEFAKLGIKIEIEGDTMRIEGGKIQSAQVLSHNDHRIAMALAAAAVRAYGAVEICNAECVEKSYPKFWKDLAKISY